MAFQDEKRTAWKTIEEVFGLTLNDVISGTPSSSTYLRGDGSWATAASGATLYSATGANTAGTEIFGTARSVAANSSFDWYGNLKLTSTDFIVGGASANTSLTITIMGESNAV